MRLGGVFFEKLFVRDCALVLLLEVDIKSQRLVFAKYLINFCLNNVLLFMQHLILLVCMNGDQMNPVKRVLFYNKP